MQVLGVSSTTDLLRAASEAHESARPERGYDAESVDFYTLGDIDDKSTKELAKGADMWCVNVPESMRLIKRDAINAETRWAVVSIDCPASVSE